VQIPNFPYLGKVGTKALEQNEKQKGFGF